jgi:DNA polymerase-3 subunit alpha
MTNRFVHLRTHSEFSLLDGIVRVKALIGQCAAEQQPAIALTDLTNLYGLVKFYQTALSQGVKPLLGADLWIENPEKEDKPFRMPVLCQNKTGYQNLKELISRAFQENQKQGKPLIKREWLLAQHQGLLLLSKRLRWQVSKSKQMYFCSLLNRNILFLPSFEAKFIAAKMRQFWFI